MNFSNVVVNWSIDITDIITTVISVVISVFIVVFGWHKEKKKDREQASIEQQLNRENEIAQELRLHRLKLLQDLDELEIRVEFGDNIFIRGDIEREIKLNSYLQLFAKVKLGFLSFGNQEEIDSLYEALDLQSDQKEFKKALLKSIRLLRNNIRLELNLNN
jgi:hypothetical protein